MKIGILTHWWGNDNYGQILQMYGLSKYLNIKNHKVTILRINPYIIQQKKHSKINRYLSILNPKKVINYMINKSKSVPNKYRMEKVPSRYFERFRQNYLPFSEREYFSLLELEEDAKHYDSIIVGSDQVWNYFSNGEDGFPAIDTYSIRFGPSQLVRLSYAASMGFNGTEETHLKRLVANLHKFKGVSVREEIAKEILERQGLLNVEWVPDPTLLLPVDTYKEFLSNDNRFRVSFFFYILNNQSIFTCINITNEMKKQDKQFILVGANRLYNKSVNAYPTVEEWLSYLEYSGTVITNSYHGCVFSILFHKNFYYFPLLPNAQGHVDSRIDSLLARLGIEGRAITTKEQLSSVIANPYKPIDWDSVDTKREEFVQAGKDFLAKHLGDSFI